MEPKNDTEEFAVACLQQLAGWTTSVINRALAQSGTFRQILVSDSARLPLSGPAATELDRLQAGRYPGLGDVVHENLARCRQAGVIPVASTSEHYPPLLREISQPPPMLYVRGELSCLALPQLAIVGSRKASRSGLENAGAFARHLAESGFCITSGMALGIDGAAHSGALQRGKTLAVLGCGWNRCYPRQHKNLMEQILGHGGAIISEFAADTPPTRENFPRRNRIISGLCTGVLVIEAALKSGSLITARYALDQGREVFALPGSIHNPQAKGCHQLIREGATLVETAEDILEQLGGLLSYHADTLSPAKDTPLDERQHRVLQLIGFDPVGVDELVDRSNETIAELVPLLMELELAGLIENREGRIQRLR